MQFVDSTMLEIFVFLFVININHKRVKGLRNEALITKYESWNWSNFRQQIEIKINQRKFILMDLHVF